MKIDYQQLGSRIASERKAQQLTQEILSEKIGMTNNYISNIENSRSIPSLETLIKICEVLDVTPDYLLIGSVKGNQEYLMGDVAEKLQRCNDKQRKLILTFIDWVIEEKL